MQFGFCNHFLSTMKTCRGSSQLAPTAQGWRTARQPLFQLAFPSRLGQDANLAQNPSFYLWVEESQVFFQLAPS